MSRNQNLSAKHKAQDKAQAYSLGEALPRIMAHVRDTLIPAYRSVGPVSGFAIAMMRADLDRAAKAMAEQDLPAMIAVYKSLEGYKL